MNIYPLDPVSNTIGYREMSNFLEAYLSCTEFDACSLQPTNGASGEHAGLLVISKYQEIIGQDLGMKSAHGTNTDSAVVPHIDIKIKWIDHSQGVPLDELKRTRQEVEDVNDVQNIEMIAVRSCKSSDYSGWNGWQSIVIETEYGDVWVDKTDENSQSLEMYNAMRQTTENEREAKDQITEQDNKYARNGRPKVENEKLSVKMRLTKAICWSHAKSEDDAAEKYVSNNAKKALAEATQMLESVLETYGALKAKSQMRKKVHQIKKRREVLEKIQEFNKEKGNDNDELGNIAARLNRMDATLQLEQDTRSLETAQLGFQDAVDAKDAEAAKRGKPEVRNSTS